MPTICCCRQRHDYRDTLLNNCHRPCYYDIVVVCVGCGDHAQPQCCLARSSGAQRRLHVLLDSRCHSSPVPLNSGDHLEAAKTTGASSMSARRLPRRSGLRDGLSGRRWFPSPFGFDRDTWAQCPFSEITLGCSSIWGLTAITVIWGNTFSISGPSLLRDLAWVLED